MASQIPPLPLRRIHGPARPAPEPDQGGGAAGTDRVIVTTPLTNTVRTTSTTQRDVTRGRSPDDCTSYWRAGPPPTLRGRGRGEVSRLVSPTGCRSPGSAGGARHRV